jgi:hypothetical protein
MKKFLLAIVFVLAAANLVVWSEPDWYDLSDPGPPPRVAFPPFPGYKPTTIYMPISCPPMPCIAVSDVPLVVNR